MSKKIVTFLISLLFLGSIALYGQQVNSLLDVASYQLELEPNIEKGSINGNVIITFHSDLNEVRFQRGNLQIINIVGESFKTYSQEKGKVKVELFQNSSKEHQLQFYFEGNPKRGLVFDQNLNTIYSVFSTDQWMVCNMDPSDRALFKFDLIVPDTLSGIASGDFVKYKPLGKRRIKYSWEQSYTSPAYTYGFTIGSFNETGENVNEVEYKYYSVTHSEPQLLKIFENTPDIVSFLEKKSGVSYVQDSYSQVLIGNHYQEMSGFSILKESYGNLVINDSLESNLITHELAHQWWGNMITCESWNHFWLNEGFATFMSAAYNEHRFGKEVYQSNIDSYYNVYKKIKDKGNDKPLVFPNWLSPSSDDRNLVYFKGAYVLHLLRQEIGDDAFWEGIKMYSQNYYNRSVNTNQFQKSMEKSTGIRLDDFFEEWVY